MAVNGQMRRQRVDVQLGIVSGASEHKEEGMFVVGCIRT
jgi:hypothetical protein